MTAVYLRHTCFDWLFVKLQRYQLSNRLFVDLVVGSDVFHDFDVSVSWISFVYCASTYFRNTGSIFICSCHSSILKNILPSLLNCVFLLLCCNFSGGRFLSTERKDYIVSDNFEYFHSKFYFWALFKNVERSRQWMSSFFQYYCYPFLLLSQLTLY